MRLIVCTLLSILGLVVSVELPLPLDATVQFVSHEDLLLFQKNNPDAVITPLKVEADEATLPRFYYKIGSRVNGDRLVASTSKFQNWETAQDIRLTLQYPTSSQGQGANITYASVIVEQSSNTGQGYVVSGGIGQRNILVFIDAYSTTYFNYLAQIYGI